MRWRIRSSLVSANATTWKGTIMVTASGAAPALYQQNHRHQRAEHEVWRSAGHKQHHVVGDGQAGHQAGPGPATWGANASSPTLGGRYGCWSFHRKVR